jgi:hypothetical protein
VLRIPSQGADKEAAASTWIILLATTEVRRATPEAGLHDYANINEKTLKGLNTSSALILNATNDPVIAARLAPGGRAQFWGAVVPATLTLTYSEPFLLSYVGLRTPTRQLGISDFSLLIRKTQDETLSAPQVVEATASFGRSFGDGQRWLLKIAPTEVQEVEVLLKHGTLGHEDRVYIGDIDLWGKPRGN